MERVAVYNKLFAAIGSTLIMRWLMQALGVDVNALGVGADLQQAVSLALDMAYAGVSGFFVWLIPNKKAS